MRIAWKWKNASIKNSRCAVSVWGRWINEVSYESQCNLLHQTILTDYKFNCFGQDMLTWIWAKSVFFTFDTSSPAYFYPITHFFRFFFTNLSNLTHSIHVWYIIIPWTESSRKSTLKTLHFQNVIKSLEAAPKVGHGSLNRDPMSDPKSVTPAPVNNALVWEVKNW